MGNSSWSADTYNSLSTGYKSKSRDKIFTNTVKTDNLMDPKGIKFRESRDSVEHPNTTAVQFWLDVTGSMGEIPEILARQKLGALMNTLVGHGLNDAQVFFGGIGDHYSDKAPLQVGQFESGTKELDQWLTKLYLEGGGGGQDMESYLLAWIFAARHTSIDCFEKRGKKGFLFTIGDEWNHDEVDSDTIKHIFGVTEATKITRQQALQEAQRTYHVFHIHVNQASHRGDTHVIGEWKKLLGERLIICEDYETIAETVATAVAMLHGIDMKNAMSGFDDKTKKLVGNALSNVKNEVATLGDKGVMAL